MAPQDSTLCYLVRHAATVNNEQEPQVVQGQRLDAELSAAGRQQAERTGRFLARRAVHAVYSSPMLRAQQTARAIASRHGLTVQVVEDLIEADVGEWEGLDWNQIQCNDPDAYRAFMTDAGANGYLGGECLREVLDRAAPAIEHLLSENRGRPIVVVAHNVVNRAYLTRLIGIPLAQYRSIPQDNCGINLLRFRENRVKVITINSVFHLDHELEAPSGQGAVSE